MKRYIWLAVGALLAVVVASLIFLWPSPERAIRIGYLPISAGTPLFVAKQRALFEKHGLQVELIAFRTSNEIGAAAASGHIDIVGTGATNAMIDAMAETGTRFQLFLLNNYVKRPNRSSTDFLLSRFEITDFSQLRGKTIAFFPGSVGRVFAAQIFRARGIPLSEIRYVEMPPPQWLPALRAGQIDAVTALEPQATMIMQELNVNVLVDGYYAEVMPSVPASGAWFIEGALTSDQENRVVRAYQEAISSIAEDRLGAINALAEYTGVPPETIRNIRLNDWVLSTDPTARQSAEKLVALFSREGGIRAVPSGEWIWQP